MTRRPVAAPLAALALFAIASTTSCARMVTPAPSRPSATARSSAAAAPSRADAAWDGFVAQYLESYFVAHPEAAVVAGRHEFDGRLPDWSERGLEREGDRLRAWRDRASRFDTTALEASRRFEHAYFLAQID